MSKKEQTKEFFQVNSVKDGKKKGEGFRRKIDAKNLRNNLQAATEKGLPPMNQSHDQSAWHFTVGRGKDHPNN